MRFVILIALSVGLFLAGFYLLSVESFSWGSLTFSGASRYFLALEIFSFAGFTGAVAKAGISGDLPTMQSKKEFSGKFQREKATHRGNLMIRYWYFIATALVSMILALILAH